MQILPFNNTLIKLKSVVFYSLEDSNKANIVNIDGCSEPTILFSIEENRKATKNCNIQLNLVVQKHEDQKHTLRGARNLSDNSDSANASPVRATVSALTPTLSKSS